MSLVIHYKHRKLFRMFKMIIPTALQNVDHPPILDSNFATVASVVAS